MTMSDILGQIKKKRQIDKVIVKRELRGRIRNCIEGRNIVIKAINIQGHIKD